MMEVAFHAASHLGHDHVDTEHLLIRLLREGEGRAVAVRKAVHTR